MKRVVAMLLTVALVLGCSMVSFAAEDVQGEDPVVGHVESIVPLNDGSEVYYYDNGYYAIISPTEILPNVARSVINQPVKKSGNYYDGNGNLGAYIEMRAYYQIDYGVEAFCYNIVCGYTPYNGWNVSIQDKSSTPRGDSVTATSHFKISKIGRTDIIELKVTCDKYGNVL